MNIKYYDEHILAYYGWKNEKSGITAWLREYFNGKF